MKGGGEEARRREEGGERGKQSKGGASKLPVGWGAMRAKLSNYCLTWEQLYLAENRWWEGSSSCQLSPFLQSSHDKVKFVSKLTARRGD